MVGICIECKSEVVAHSGTPFCEDCAEEFYNEGEADERA